MLLITLTLSAQDNNTPVSFTLGDRDRLMRNEQKIDGLRSEMNVKFDAVNGRIDSLQGQMVFLTTLIMFVLGGLMSLIGFVIYDRRTAIKPVQREQAELAEEVIQLKRQISIFSESMRKAGML